MTDQIFDPPVGHAQEIAPGLRRILAPNPSPMTYRGTNTYILGERQCLVIDPGPDDPEHLKAILKATKDAKVSHIFVSHSHLDHSPLAGKLSDKTGAPILAHGDSKKGQSVLMRALASQGLAGGGEGVDANFTPDVYLTNGQIIATDEWQVIAWHTPGHMGNHMVLQWGDAVFSADLVMGWATSLVSPPDGDLKQFLASCVRVKELSPRVLFPGHGAPVLDPIARIDWLVSHRNSRTKQLLAALSEAPKSVMELTEAVYHDVDKNLLPAAARNLFAHLVALHQDGAVDADPELGPEARFRRLETEGKK